MNKRPYKREILYHTDDEQEAFDKAAIHWAKGEENVTVAKVSQMLSPPETAYAFVVIKITEL